MLQLLAWLFEQLGHGFQRLASWLSRRPLPQTPPAHWLEHIQPHPPVHWLEYVRPSQQKWHHFRHTATPSQSPMKPPPPVAHPLPANQTKTAVPAGTPQPHAPISISPQPPQPSLRPQSSPVQSPFPNPHSPFIIPNSQFPSPIPNSPFPWPSLPPSPPQPPADWQQTAQQWQRQLRLDQEQRGPEWSA